MNFYFSFFLFKKIIFIFFLDFLTIYLKKKIYLNLFRYIFFYFFYFNIICNLFFLISKNYLLHFNFFKFFLFDADVNYNLLTFYNYTQIYLYPINKIKFFPIEYKFSLLYKLDTFTTRSDLDMILETNYKNIELTFFKSNFYNLDETFITKFIFLFNKLDTILLQNKLLI